jgi:hypothetical protein
VYCCSDSNVCEQDHVFQDAAAVQVRNAAAPSGFPLVVRFASVLCASACHLSRVPVALPLCRYYDLPFCTPRVLKKESENLGEILAGDRIESSDYELLFGKDEFCKVLCKKDYGRKHARKLSKRIEQDYQAHWYAAAVCGVVRRRRAVVCSRETSCLPRAVQDSGQPARRGAQVRPQRPEGRALRARLPARHHGAGRHWTEILLYAPFVTMLQRL